jgi:outer membrane lipoprotein carrier protein
MRLRSWIHTLKIATATIAPLVFGATCLAQAPERQPEEVQRALQQRYDLIRDVSADFRHTYEGGMLRTSLVEQGTVLFKTPGRMRWNYEEPERKLYLSDGERFYSYLSEDRQVIIGHLPSGSEATAAVLFLAGAGNFVDDFTATYDTVQDPPPDSYVLRLTPTRTERDFEFLTIVVDAHSLAILRLIAYDLQGGLSTFFFSNLKENQGLSDTPFRFEIPRGTDVIDPTQTDTPR